MAIYTPYTYLIGWTKQNRWYYGVRYARKNLCLYETGCHPDDFWVTYFTSSKEVEKFRGKHGDPDIIQIRKTFMCKYKAREWEDKVLIRLNAHKREEFLNKHAGKAIILDEEDFKKIKENRERKWNSLSKDEKEAIRTERSRLTKDFWHSLTETERKELLHKSNVKRKLNREENWDDEFRENLKQKKQESWKISPKRRAHSEKTRVRRLEEEANRTDDEREKISKICSEAYWSRPEEKIKEQHAKQSKGTKKSYENNPELRKLRSETFKGRISINKDGKNKRVKPEEVDEYYRNGWVKGSIQNRKNVKPTCLGKKAINKDGIARYVPAEEVEKYLTSGWSLGLK